MKFLLGGKCCLLTPPSHTGGLVGCYLEPPAQAVGVLIDRCHLAVALLTQLRHCVHKTLQLQLSAVGEKPVLARLSQLPYCKVMTSLCQERENTSFSPGEVTSLPVRSTEQPSPDLSTSQKLRAHLVQCYSALPRARLGSASGSPFPGSQGLLCLYPSVRFCKYASLV